MPVEQQERALPRRAGRLLELLRGLLRRADRLLIDRQDDIAARQPQRVGGAAVIDAGDDDASDVASEMQLAAHVGRHRPKVQARAWAPSLTGLSTVAGTAAHPRVFGRSAAL